MRVWISIIELGSCLSSSIKIGYTCLLLSRLIHRAIFHIKDISKYAQSSIISTTKKEEQFKCLAIVEKIKKIVVHTFL